MKHIWLFIFTALFFLLCTACDSKKAAANKILAEMKSKGVRCVFVKNHKKEAATFSVSVNYAAPETIILQPDHGLFFYEPRADETEASLFELTHISFSGQGMSMSGDVFEGEASANGWVSPESITPEPTEKWLSDSHLEPRLTHKLRAVEVKIPPPPAAAP